MTNYKFNSKRDDFNNLLILEIEGGIDKEVFGSFSDFKSDTLKIAFVEKESIIYYDINSMYSLSFLLESQRFDERKLRKLLSEVFDIQNRFISKCLPITSLVLDIERIYYSVADERFYFIMLPFYVEKAKTNTFDLLMRLSEYFDNNKLVTPTFLHDYSLYLSSGSYTLKGVHNIHYKKNDSVEYHEAGNENRNNHKCQSESCLIEQPKLSELKYSYVAVECDESYVNYDNEMEYGDVFSVEEENNEEEVKDSSMKRVLLLSFLFEVFSICLFALLFTRYAERFENKLYAFLGMGLIFLLANISILKNVFLKDVQRADFNVLRKWKQGRKSLDVDREEFKIDVNALKESSDNRTVSMTGTSESGSGLLLLRKDTGLEYRVSDASLIGRSKESADVYIDNKTVGRKHAIISKVAGKYYIKDLGSLNGTFLNKRKLKKDRSEILSNGDIIKVSNVKMKVVL